MCERHSTPRCNQQKAHIRFLLFHKGEMELQEREKQRSGSKGQFYIGIPEGFACTNNSAERDKDLMIALVQRYPGVEYRRRTQPRSTATE